MSYFLPFESTTFLKRNALRSRSAMPPRNCQRTSGCISVSLLIARSTVTSSPAFSSARRCSCRSAYFLSMGLFGGDFLLADDGRPLRLVGFHHGGELAGGAGDEIAVLRLQALLHGGIRESLLQGVVEQIDHRAGRSRRREHRHPGLGGEAGISLGDRRQLGEKARALRCADAERGEL